MARPPSQSAIPRSPSWWSMLFRTSSNDGTTLEGHGFQDYSAADGPAALDRASAAPPDVSPVSAVAQAGWRSQSTKRLVERMR